MDYRIIIVLSLISLILFSYAEIKEIIKMREIKEEETNRINLIKEQINNDKIEIPHYKNDVWEGDYISEEYKKYYSIPNETEVITY